MRELCGYKGRWRLSTMLESMIGGGLYLCNLPSCLFWCFGECGERLLTSSPDGEASWICGTFVSRLYKDKASGKR